MFLSLHRLIQCTRWSVVMVCLCSFSFTTGCAISKKACLQDDWQTRGYTDGRAGTSPDVLSAYAKKCGKYGVTPDPTAYQAGFDVGVVEYCTPEKGYRAGRDDKAYNSVCPVELERGFLQSYVSGLNTAFDDLAFEYDNDDFRLDTLRDERARLNADGVSTSKLNKRIKSLESSMRRNVSKRRSIRNKIREWEAQL